MSRCSNTRTNSRRTVDARVISGCRRQLVEVLLFLPVLVIAIAIGLGILILRFWLANWNPSLLNGCFSLVAFTFTPTIVFFYWMRWRMRKSAADTILTVTVAGLQIQGQHGLEPAHLLEWNWIERAHRRKIAPSTRTLKIIARDPNRGSYAVEFALLAEPPHADWLSELVVRRVRLQLRTKNRRPSQSHV